VIAPDVVITDLEPDGFYLICQIAEQRQRRAERVVSVLHDAGEVVTVVDSHGGVLDAHREPFTDAQDRGAALLAETGADRVVLYDRAQLDELASRLADIPVTVLPQQRVFWDNADAFWSSPAIATAPPHHPDPWRVAPALLRRAEGGWALLALYDGERCAATLLAQVSGGMVCAVTSLDAVDGAERPPRDRAAELVEIVESHLGAVRLGLICDAADLSAAFDQDDVPAAVAALARDRAIWSRGWDDAP
jgi:hypothetical protein